MAGSKIRRAAPAALRQKGATPERPRLARPGPSGPRQRRSREGRIGVVDIGSNSIRLVVFDRLARAPLLLFNEKVLCGLGRGLSRDGRLNEEGVESALMNLGRFVRLAKAMGVARLDMLATAAVRDAVNGAAFAETVRQRWRVPVRILSGSEEARLSRSEERRVGKEC